MESAGAGPFFPQHAELSKESVAGSLVLVAVGVVFGGGANKKLSA
jgi:hypothetical protein